MAIDPTQLKADTVAIIGDWAETLTIKRLPTNKSYNDSGIGTDPYSVTVVAVTGDWQSGTGRHSGGGKTERKESGLNIEYDALAVLPFGTDVLENDRIYKADGTYEYVIFVEENEDHVIAYLNKTKLR